MNSVAMLLPPRSPLAKPGTRMMGYVSSCKGSGALEYRTCAQGMYVTTSFAFDTGTFVLSL